jgi:hypothetical protein
MVTLHLDDHIRLEQDILPMKKMTQMKSHPTLLSRLMISNSSMSIMKLSGSLRIGMHLVLMKKCKNNFLPFLLKLSQDISRQRIVD